MQTNIQLHSFLGNLIKQRLLGQYAVKPHGADEFVRYLEVSVIPKYKYADNICIGD